MARKMKDSGIEWIGEIPEEWETGKVKKYYNIQIGFTPDTKNELLYDDTNGYDWVNISDMIDGQTIINTKKKISQYYIEICKPKIIPKGSLMYSFKLSVGQTAYAGKNIYSNEAIASFLPSETVNLFFLRYSSIFIILNAQTNIYNAKILNQDLIKNAYVIFPTLDEQQRIADFLDQKCAQIDEILQKTRDTIAEYKKLKQSIITQAVTKGVRGKRLMKDSGIEWIGEIPEEWEIARLKRDFSFGKGLPITKDNLIENGLAVISYGQIHSKHNTGVRIYNDLIRYVSNDYIKTNSSSLVHKGDFIFADTSEDLDGCGNCVYVDRQLQLFAGYHTIILFSKNDLCNKYLAYLFKTDQWRSQIRSRVSGVKLFSISRKILANATIIFPALDEQQEIALYLDEKCAEIDTLIEKKEQLVNELESYKKSLIYEYVTGKKEVVI